MLSSSITTFISSALARSLAALIAPEMREDAGADGCGMIKANQVGDVECDAERLTRILAAFVRAKSDAVTVSEGRRETAEQQPPALARPQGN